MSMESEHNMEMDAPALEINADPAMEAVMGSEEHAAAVGRDQEQASRPAEQGSTSTALEGYSSPCGHGASAEAVDVRPAPSGPSREFESS